MPKSAGKDSRKSSSKVTDFDPSLVSLFDSSVGGSISSLNGCSNILLVRTR